MNRHTKSMIRTVVTPMFIAGILGLVFGNAFNLLGVAPESLIKEKVLHLQEAFRENVQSVGLLSPRAVATVATSAQEVSPAQRDEVARRIDVQQVRLEYARVLMYAKKYPEAEAQYRALLASDTGRASLKVELAQVLFWQGKREESTSVLGELPLSALDKNSILLKVYQLQDKKDYQAAKVVLQQALVQFPEDGELSLLLAETLSWNKDYVEALALYEKLLAVDENNKQLRRKYAMVLSWAGNHSAAAKEFKRTF